MNHLFHLLGLTLLTAGSMARGQIFEPLHSFVVNEGGASRSGLVQGSDGHFYGTASSWGDTNVSAFGYGTIFRVSASGAVTRLVSFESTNGASPRGPLVQGSDGHFYGTTFLGGATNLGGTTNSGTASRITTNGVLTMLLSFTNGNGSFPIAGLAEGPDGNFYGSTSAGGANGFGTLFKMTPNGQLNTLVAFDGTNGSSPRGTLVTGSDGHFYGTTFSGGVDNYGTVFKMTANGTLTTLFSFTASTGRNPSSKLTLGWDGSFYGTTFLGGLGNVGTVFRITTNGNLTTLASFDVANGSYPQAGLVLGIDNSFYGTTSQGGMTNQGGTTNSGTLFQITPDGSLNSLISFTTFTNGISPLGGLVRDSSGNLYGTMASGGNGIGTVYRIVFPHLNLRLSGNETVLSWPTNMVGFTLQSSTNLNSSANWIDSGNAPVVLDKEFVVTNSISGGAQFYRLKK